MNIANYVGLLTSADLQIVLAQAQSLASGVIAAAWQSALLVCVVSLTLKLVPRTVPAFRFSVWLTTLLAILCLPLISHYSRSSLLSAASPLAGAVGSSATHAGLEAGLHVDLRWGLLLVAIWALCSSVQAVRLVLHAFYLRRLWISAEPISNLDSYKHPTRGR